MCNKLLQDFNKNLFEDDLISWFHREKRDLPWRRTKDPYKIWVSEIMLQQTRVDTVIPYYENFLEKFPTVEALAEADTNDVLKAWEGLGYYSRARNLQHAARDVVKLYSGVIPANKTLLGKLKGIGPYTCGAILSIAFNQPEPAIDGNVMRVISRVLNIHEDIAIQRNRKIFEEAVAGIITKKDPSGFNQGLMELGATVCTPTKPSCLLCPVQAYCRAFYQGIEESLPVKSKAKRKKSLTYFVLLIQNEDGQVLIEKRENEGLLASLWQFPMVQSNRLDKQKIEADIKDRFQITVHINEKQGDLKHIFTHLIWNLKVYNTTTIEAKLKNEQHRFVDIEDLKEYPFPVSHQKVMKFL